MNTGSISRQYRLLAALALLALLVLTAIFYPERAWFLDIAFQTFLLIRDETVQVMVYRFGAAVVQALPLAGIKLGLPLKVVSLLYSISFPLLYLLFYVVITYVLRQWQLGLALVLLYTLMVYEGFYWATSELQQGLGFLLVIFAFWRRYPALDRWWQWALLAPALVALAFYHPLVPIPFFFGWLYLGWTDRRLRHGRFLVLAALMLAVLFAKSQYYDNWYDAAKMATFRENLTAHFPNYFTFPAYGRILDWTWRYWWGWPLLLLPTLGWLGAHRRWVAVFLVVSFSMGFLVLTAIGDPALAYRFYAEVNLYPLVIFAALPFCVEVLPALSEKHRWPLYALALLLAVRLLVIGLHHRPYTARLASLKETLERAERQHPQTNRYYLPTESAAMDTLIMTWAVPYETLLLSAAETRDSAKTLFIVPPDGTRFDSSLQRRDVLVSEFGDFPVELIEGKYFDLGEGAYERIAH